MYGVINIQAKISKRDWNKIHQLLNKPGSIMSQLLNVYNMLNPQWGRSSTNWNAHFQTTASVILHECCYHLGLNICNTRRRSKKSLLLLPWSLKENVTKVYEIKFRIDRNVHSLTIRKQTPLDSGSRKPILELKCQFDCCTILSKSTSILQLQSFDCQAHLEISRHYG